MINSGITLPGPLASLSRVNIRYLIEWHKNGQLYKSIALPLPPNSLSVQSTAPKVITYTLGAFPIREIGKYKQRTIELNGSAGYDARPSFLPSGAIISEFGPQILINFRSFLEEYQTVVSVEGPQTITGPQHELIFRALDEGFNLRVEVESFSVQRSADENNLAPSWSLLLESYDLAAPPLQSNVIENFFAPVTEALNKAAAAAAAAQLVTEGANAYVRRGLQGPLDGLTKISNALRGTVEAARELADIPADLIRRFSSLSGQIRSSLSLISDTVQNLPNEIKVETDLLLQTIGLCEEAQEQADLSATYTPSIEILEQALEPPILPQSQEPNFREQIESASIYRLRLGEDLRILAARILNDPERWSELADLNGWISESRNARGLPAKAGDLILIPSVIPLTPQGTGSDPYGEDLFLDPKTGDLDLLASDFRTVQSTENLEQAIRNRLSAQQGASILQKYGLPLQIGERISIESAGYLGSHIREQTLNDPRISDLKILELRDQGDHLNVDLELQTFAGGFLRPSVRI